MAVAVYRRRCTSHFPWRVCNVLFLRTKPADAKWLTEAQRQWLKRTLEIEHARTPACSTHAVVARAIQ